MPHGQHTQTTKLFWSVEYHWREPAWHLRVQTNLYSSLDLVLALDEQVEKLLSVDDCFTEVSHETDESCIPFVGDFCECRGARGHQDLPNTVFKPFYAIFIDPYKGLCCDLFRIFVLKLPYAILLRKFFLSCPLFRENTNFKATHVEKQVRVVLRVDRDKTVFPLDCGQCSRKPVLDLPENCTAQIHIMLDQAHAAVPWPAFFVVVADDILIVWIWVFCEEALDKISRILFVKLKNYVNLVDIAHVQAYRVAYFSFHVLETHKLIRLIYWTCKLKSPLLSKHTQVKHQSIVLEHKARELEASNKAVRISVTHVLVRYNNVVLCRHVVS